MGSRRWRGGAAAVLVIAAGLAAYVVARVHGVQSAAALVAITAALVGLAAALWRWSGTRSRVLAAGTVVVLLAAVAGASLWLDARRPERLPTGSGTLRILAGVSLVDDMRPILEAAAEATGVTVEFTPQEGTLAAVERVLSGDAGRAHDAIWLPSNRYLLLHPQAQGRIVAPGTSIARSPVVLGLRAEVAARLGWDATRPRWADIAAAVDRREFSYGMTKPYVSNSGFSTLAAAATALATGGDRPLVAADIQARLPALRAFFAGQSLTSGSTGELTKLFKNRAEAGRPVDGLFSYEAELFKINASLPQPLTMIYPAEGTVVADFPLTLLATASPQARANYEAVVAYLRSPAGQRAVLERTHRRPVAGNVALPDEYGPRDLRDLPFPGDRGTADALLATYEERLRNPARTIYILDVSGSMCWPLRRPAEDRCAPAGDRRMDQVRAALTSLAGAQPGGTLSRELTRFAEREQVILIEFSSQVRPPQTITMTARLAEGQARVRAAAEALEPGGATALYEALRAAYQLAGRLIAEDPHRYTTIVLLSDGEANGALDFFDFRTYFTGLTGPAADVPVFPIIFGEGVPAEMADVAELTHGKVFDGTTDPLAEVFADIRGYQ